MTWPVIIEHKLSLSSTSNRRWNFPVQPVCLSVFMAVDPLRDLAPHQKQSGSRKKMKLNHYHNITTNPRVSLMIGKRLPLSVGLGRQAFTAGPLKKALPTPPKPGIVRQKARGKQNRWWHDLTPTHTRGHTYTRRDMH